MHKTVLTFKGGSLVLFYRDTDGNCRLTCTQSKTKLNLPSFLPEVECDHNMHQNVFIVGKKSLGAESAESAKSAHS